MAKLAKDTRQALFVTFLGGRGDDRVLGIAVNTSGTVYVGGYTQSVDFAATPINGGRDGFVAMLNETGGSPAFISLIGGSDIDGVNAVALSPNGDLWIVGQTKSSTFPVLNALQSTYAGSQDGFIARYSATGVRQYSSYFGGAGVDTALSIAIDSSGSPHITGSTDSVDLPVSNAAFRQKRGGYDAFVARLNVVGSSLIYSTYIGGQLGSSVMPESAYAIAIDINGIAVIVGTTPSRDFPTLNAFQAVFGEGDSDAFLTRLSPSGVLLSSSYYGGALSDAALTVAVSTSGIWLGGITTSPNLPVVDSVQPVPGGLHDGFAAKFTIDGRSLQFSSYFGGSGSDTVSSLRVLPNGSLCVAGYTGSGNWGQVTFQGSIDGYVFLLLGPPSTEDFVTRLYQDVLIRPPDPVGLAYWTAAISTGSYRRARAAEAFLTSQEAFDGALYVVKLYLGLLLRNPDYAGWRLWTGMIARGQPRSVIISHFLTSPEFQNRYGLLNNGGFVRQLYINMLGREPEPVGLEYWMKMLVSGVSRESVAASFIDTPEFHHRVLGRAQVNLFYLSLLRRTGDSQGLAYWQGYLSANPLWMAIEGVIMSPEFMNSFS